MEKAKNEITSEAAKKILEKEALERQSKCGKELEEVLNKYQCRLEPTVILKQNNVMTQISIIPV